MVRLAEPTEQPTYLCGAHGGSTLDTDLAAARIRRLPMKCEQRSSNGSAMFPKRQSSVAQIKFTRPRGVWLPVDGKHRVREMLRVRLQGLTTAVFRDVR